MKASQMNRQTLIHEYLQGPQQLREAIRGMSPEQLQAVPIAGLWSTHQVICHLTDFELINTYRIMRVIAEDNPLLQDADPDPFALRLNYQGRTTEKELRLIEAAREHIGLVLASLDEVDFQKKGHHSVDGELTLEQFVARNTSHIPHHIKFIEAKRAALNSATP